MQLPERRGILGTLQVLKLGCDPRDYRDRPQQNPRNLGAQALFVDVIGAIGISFSRGQSQIEESHWNDLAEFRIGHTDKHAHRLLDLANLGLLSCNLLWRDGRAHGLNVHCRPGLADEHGFGRWPAGFCGLWHWNRLREPADWRTALQSALELGNTPEFVQSFSVIDFQQLGFFERSYVIYGYVHAIHVAQDAAALFLQRFGTILALRCSRVKELVELLAEHHVVRSNRGEHAGMIEGNIERLLQLAHPADNVRIQQGVQVMKISAGCAS